MSGRRLRNLQPQEAAQLLSPPLPKAAKPTSQPQPSNAPSQRLHPQPHKSRSLHHQNPIQQCSHVAPSVLLSPKPGYPPLQSSAASPSIPPPVQAWYWKATATQPHSRDSNNSRHYAGQHTAVHPCYPGLPSPLPLPVEPWLGARLRHLKTIASAHPPQPASSQNTPPHSSEQFSNYSTCHQSNTVLSRPQLEQQE